MTLPYIRPLKPANTQRSPEEKAFAKAKAEHVRKYVSILRFLADLGYEIDPERHEEQQFRCDLHGGEDHKPSARAYTDTNLWYCWGCQKVRGPISTLRAKVPGLSFAEACQRLTGKYNIPPFQYAGPGLPGHSVGGVADLTKSQLSDIKSREDFEREQKRLERLLEVVTETRELTLKQTTTLWASFDVICWHIESQEWGDPCKGTAYLEKVRLKVMGLLGCCHEREEGAQS